MSAGMAGLPFQVPAAGEPALCQAGSRQVTGQTRSDGKGNACVPLIPGSQVQCQVAVGPGAADQRAAVGGVIDRVGGVADRSGQQGYLTRVAHAGAA